MSATLALARASVRRAAPWRRVADVIAVVAVVASLARAGRATSPGGISADPGDATPLPSPLWVVLSLFLPVIVVRRILQHRQVVAARRCLGAVCAYLLIAFTFTFVFLTVNVLDTEPLLRRGASPRRASCTSASPASRRSAPAAISRPASDLGQLLSVTETIIGQIFLVTLVAALVGLYAARRRAEA